MGLWRGRQKGRGATAVFKLNQRKHIIGLATERITFDPAESIRFIIIFKAATEGSSSPLVLALAINDDPSSSLYPFNEIEFVPFNGEYCRSAALRDNTGKAGNTKYPR